MLRLYCTKYANRRWPMVVFYDMLDKAAVNAHVLLKQATGEDISRREFIIQLGKEQCTEQLQSRDPPPQLVNEDKHPTLPTQSFRKICTARKCKNRLNNSCQKCHKTVCGQHSVVQKRTFTHCVTCCQLYLIEICKVFISFIVILFYVGN